MQQLNTMRTKFISLKVIFIDEISMVGQNMFNFINLRLQEIKGCTLPFGGTSIVTVGDLFQLRPVMDNWIFTQSNKGYGPLAANLWRDNFKLFELTVIMRQRDDKIFAELLNRIREGNQTEEDMSLLKTCVKEECQEISNNRTCLLQEMKLHSTIMTFTIKLIILKKCASKLLIGS